MTLDTFKAEQFIDQPVEKVFSFFKKPENLNAITPGNLGFKILTPSPILMAKGTVIDYTIKLYGVPMKWKTEITDYNPPHSFTDTQLKGPYQTWIHTHRFIPQNNGTLMTDEVCYSISMGFLGQIAKVLFVENEIKKIFEHRKKVISEIFMQEAL